MKIKTWLIGDCTPVNNRVVFTSPGRLLWIYARHNLASAIYLQVHDTQECPPTGNMARLTFLAPQKVTFSPVLPDLGIDLKACSLVFSSDATTYVQADPNSIFEFQAVVRAKLSNLPT